MLSDLPSPQLIKALAATTGLLLSPSPRLPEIESPAASHSELGELQLPNPSSLSDSPSPPTPWHSLLEKHCFSGVLFLEGTPGGYSSREQSESLFPLASLSKQFTAAAVFALIERGRLSLDQPLGELLPETPSDKKEITIRQLLTHTSGLSPDIPLAIDPRHRDAMLNGILRSPLTFTPGSRWNYANSGYILLAGIVERISGQSFTSFVEQAVLQPLGMHSTFFYGDARLTELVKKDPETMLHAKSKERGSDYLTRAVGWGMMGAGGMVSSSKDLSRWYESLRAIPEEHHGFRRELLSPVEQGYTAGGLYFSLLPDGRPVVGHDGVDRWGNKSFFAAALDTPGTAILYSREGIIPDELRRAATLGLVGAAPATLPLSEIRSHCGSYHTERGDRLEISLITDRYDQGLYLLTNPTGEALELVASPSHELRADICRSLTEHADTIVQDLLRGSTAENPSSGVRLQPVNFTPIISPSESVFLFPQHREALRALIIESRLNASDKIVTVGTSITPDGYAYETRIQIAPRHDVPPMEYVLLWAAAPSGEGYQIQAAGLSSSIYRDNPQRQKSLVSLPCYPSEGGDAYYFDPGTRAPSIRLHFSTNMHGAQTVEVYTGRGMITATRVE